MIAYVFWHTRSKEIDTGAFEGRLGVFHRSLAEHVPDGYVSSVSMRFGRLPWMGDEVVYEDWYFVNDFAALGVLNERAVAGRHARAHDDVASYSGRATGSIYRLEAGSPRDIPKHVYWMDRPPARKTAGFVEDLKSLTRSNSGVLWRRQLSLGPAVEYCIHSAEQLTLSCAFIEVEPEGIVWP